MKKSIIFLCSFFILLTAFLHAINEDYPLLKLTQKQFQVICDTLGIVCDWKDKNDNSIAGYDEITLKKGEMYNLERISFLYIDDDGLSGTDAGLYLLQLIIEGAKTKVSFLLASGINPDLKDKNGKTTVLEAVKKRNWSDICINLLEKGASPDEQDEYKRTALMYTLEKGTFKELFPYFLKAGVNLNIQDSDGKSILILAVQNSPDYIPLLMQGNADPLLKDNKNMCALDYAEKLFLNETYLTAMEKKLPEEKQKENAFRRKSVSLIINAVTSNDFTGTKKLLEQGVKPDVKDRNGDTLLYIAARNNNREMMNLLLDFNADIYYEPEYNETISLIFKNNWDDIAIRYFEKGFDVNYPFKNVPYIKELRSYFRFPFLLACARGSLELVNYMISKGVNLNQYRGRETPLITTIRFNQLEVVKTLCDAGANINCIGLDPGGIMTTPLIIACERQCKEIAMYLLDRDADAGYIRSDVENVLVYSVKNGWLTVTKRILNQYVLPDIPEKNPLREAVRENNFFLVHMLLKAGADVNYNRQGPYLLDHVYNTGNIDMLEKLLQAGIEVIPVPKEFENRKYSLIAFGDTQIVKQEIDLLLNYKFDDMVKGYGYKLLCYAARHGWIDIVKRLLEKKNMIDLNQQENDMPLLKNAVYSGSFDLVALLLDNGADPNVYATNGESPLASALDKKNEAIAKLLISRGADINCIYKKGRLSSALSRALMNKLYSLAEWMIGQGADVTIENNVLFPNLLTACRAGQLDLVKALIKAKVDINKTDINLKSALHYAAETGNIELVDFLLENGLSINETDIKGNTVLHYAALSGNSRLVRYLIQKGMNVHQVNMNNETPLFFTAQKFDKESSLVLLDAGSDINAINNVGETVLSALIPFHDKKADINKVSDFVIFCLTKKADITHRLGGATLATRLNRYSKLKKIRDICLISENPDNGLKEYIENPDYVSFALLYGADVNTKDSLGNTPLFRAVELELTGVIELLLAWGASTIVKNALGEDVFAYAKAYRVKEPVIGIMKNLDDRKLLLLAIKHDVVHMAKKYFDSLSRAGTTKEEPDTYLFIALEHGAYECTKYFLEKTDAGKLTDELGNTPLLYAAGNNWPDIIDSFIARGADINITNKEHKSALYFASKTKSIRAVRTLLDHGIVLGSDSVYLLKMLIEMDIGELFDRILPLLPIDKMYSDEKAECEAVLALACEKNKVTLVKALVAGGIDVNTRIQNNKTALFFALQAIDKDTVEFLLKHGADTNIIDKDGETPLFQAARSGDTQLVQLILDHKGNISARNNFGGNILSATMWMNDYEMVCYLVSKGAYVNNINNNGNTPLMLISQYANFTIIKCLLENGAAPNIRNKKGETALMFLARARKPWNKKYWSHTYIDFSTYLFIRHNALIDIKDNTGKTVFDYPVNKSMESILKEAGEYYENF